MRVVLDCNILVACLSSHSPYHNIYKSLVAQKFDLVVSQDILLEYEEIIRVKYSLATTQSFMALLSLLPNVHYVHPFYKWNLISVDTDDNKYCDCAVSGAADYIAQKTNILMSFRMYLFRP
jgi:putative PIN family toxin of toxin-antitoxin system